MENPDINALLERYYGDPAALLLDVRDGDEYARGHIPGARSVPFQTLRDFCREVRRDTPLYVYCHSGGRSLKAATVLKGVGYAHVTDLGGMDSYTGELET